MCPKRMNGSAHGELRDCPASMGTFVWPAHLEREFRGENATEVSPPAPNRGADGYGDGSGDGES